MSEQSRRRTWIPVAETNSKPHNCSGCGDNYASYSLNQGWNWFCWKCMPKETDWDSRNEQQ